MILYQITYESSNRYEEEVLEAFFEFLVAPDETSGQSIVKDKITHSVEGTRFYAQNVFGYYKLCLRLAKPFRKFNFRYECLLQKEKDTVFPTQFDMLALEEEQQILDSESFQVDAYPFLNQSYLTDISVIELPEYMLKKQNQALLEYINHLNQSIHNYLRYTPNSSTTFTNARETLVSQKGVCQDYAHFMLGILRSQHIPCRYVSGYLHQGQDILGSAQMHAWVEVLFPKYGWVGFDPTNNLFADHHYIKIADGQDYEDCRAINGFIKPGTINYTEYSVSVVDQ
ncbi:transglutaminase family protein [Catalinimonas sp. 4WD22]|uniref:transglutaminase-like domain-containing protein n=1 Tax=Catalinimonas locisalis TaxID=3133978 RepID=UPI0031018E9D